MRASNYASNPPPSFRESSPILYSAAAGRGASPGTSYPTQTSAKEMRAKGKEMQKLRQLMLDPAGGDNSADAATLKGKSEGVLAKKCSEAVVEAM